MDYRLCTAVVSKYLQHPLFCILGVYHTVFLLSVAVVKNIFKNLFLHSLGHISVPAFIKPYLPDYWRVVQVYVQIRQRYHRAAVLGVYAKGGNYPGIIFCHLLCCLVGCYIHRCGYRDDLMLPDLLSCLTVVRVGVEVGMKIDIIRWHCCHLIRYLTSTERVTERSPGEATTPLSAEALANIIGLLIDSL